MGPRPLGRLSAPVSGTLPWYADGEGTDPRCTRRGGRAPPADRPDRPDGPFDPLTRAAEQARVGTWRDAVDAELGQLLGDPVTPPARVVTSKLSASVAADGSPVPWQRLPHACSPVS